jgi:putative Ca2+/H+ antiporter (TMEM165/GDT1 family)
MLETFLTTYIAVFVAEIVGDKLLYTSGVLATRFRWGAVISGMSLAFMAKMAVAAFTVPWSRSPPSFFRNGATRG